MSELAERLRKSGKWEPTELSLEAASAIEAKDKLIDELVEALEYAKRHLPVWDRDERGIVLWLHMAVNNALSKANHNRDSE